MEYLNMHSIVSLFCGFGLGVMMMAVVSAGAYDKGKTDAKREML